MPGTSPGLVNDATAAIRVVIFNDLVDGHFLLPISWKCFFWNFVLQIEDGIEFKNKTFFSQKVDQNWDEIDRKEFSVLENCKSMWPDVWNKQHKIS